jgi:hypothetical protein
MQLPATVVASPIPSVARRLPAARSVVAATERSTRPAQSFRTRQVQVGLAGVIGT